MIELEWRESHLTDISIVRGFSNADPFADYIHIAVRSK